MVGAQNSKLTAHFSTKLERNFAPIFGVKLILRNYIPPLDVSWYISKEVAAQNVNRAHFLAQNELKTLT